MDRVTKTTADGLTAYDILEIPGCPYKLPKARSMTQAANDFYGLQDAILAWYHNNMTLTNTK